MLIYALPKNDAIYLGEERENNRLRALYTPSKCQRGLELRGKYSQIFFGEWGRWSLSQPWKG